MTKTDYMQNLVPNKNTLPVEKAVPVVLINFSGVYERQTFYHGYSENLITCNLKGMPGMNCYCDEESRNRLTALVNNLPKKGIHLIDSGNYHYMTRIWLSRIRQPFRLMVFDNHTDMQPPAFGRLLSCGGWILEAMEELPALQEVILIGPDEAAWKQTDEATHDRIVYLGREEIADMAEAAWLDFFSSLPMDLPWYLSIDKDILCREDAVTAWSQGEVKLRMLLDGLQSFRKALHSREGILLGADVCGEDAPEGTENPRNDRANKVLLEELLRFYA